MPKSFIYILLATGIVACLLVTLTRTQGPSVTLEGIDKLIKQEIPIGSSKDQVYKFLDSRKIMSTGYDVGPDPLLGLPVWERQRKRYVMAWIPENPNLDLSDYDIRIFFYFDEEQNLIDYKLEQLDNVP